MSFEEGKDLPWIFLPVCSGTLPAAFEPPLAGQSMLRVPSRICFGKMFMTDGVGWLGYGGRGTFWPFVMGLCFAFCPGSLMCQQLGLVVHQDSSAWLLHLDCKVRTSFIAQEEAPPAMQPPHPCDLVCHHLPWAHR